MEFQYEFRGEDVVIKVDWYKPGTPAGRTGHPDNWYPEEFADFEWRILDDFDGEEVVVKDLTRAEELEIDEEVVNVMEGLIEDWDCCYDDD